MNSNFFKLTFLMAFLTVTFHISAQDTLLTHGAFFSNNNLLVMEVEAAVPTSNWQLGTSIPGYTGSGYYTWKGSEHFGNPGIGLLAYPIIIEEAGDYNLHIRSYHSHHDKTLHNDVWAKMDNGSWYKVYSHDINFWSWFTKFDLHNNQYPQASFNLSKGKHIFYLSARSSEFSLDRIVFAKSSVSSGVWQTASQSEYVSINSDTIPPSEVTGIVATGMTYKSFNISWDAATDDIGVSGYNVYIDGMKKNTNLLNVRTFSLINLTPSTSYILKVEAVDWAGNCSAMADSVVVMTNDPDTEPPTVPVLDDVIVFHNKVTVKWHPSTDNYPWVSYRYYRSSHSFNAISKTDWTSLNLIPGTDYLFWITAIDAAGNESEPLYVPFTTLTLSNLPEHTIKVQVMPNPSTGNFMISMPLGSVIGNISLTDLQGRKYSPVQMAIIDERANVDFGRLSKGNYILSVATKAGIAHSKVFITD